jgi:LysM repeat protein
LITGLIVTATVLGALVLSVRGQPTSITELPIPTVTFQSDFPSPVPTRGVTQPAVTAIAVEPSATPTPTPTICPIPPDWQRYSVGPFDTLNSIAQRFSLTPDQLAQMNCLDKPGVTTGQTIYVPGFKPTPTSVPCFPPFNWAIYIVRPGDTLNVIAARYGISTYTLMRANCLSTTYIYYGQALYVPPTYPIVTFVPTPIIQRSPPPRQSARHTPRRSVDRCADSHSNHAGDHGDARPKRHLARRTIAPTDTPRQPILLHPPSRRQTHWHRRRLRPPNHLQRPARRHLCLRRLQRHETST